MLKKLTWQHGDVFAVKIRKDLYSVAQMKENQLMEFFDIFSPLPRWEHLDLNEQRILFCVYISEKCLRPILVERLLPDWVIPNRRPTSRKMLNALFGTPILGAELIELTPDFSNVGARVLKGPLRLETDLATIHAYELTGMVGDPAKLCARLARCADTGVNWDDSKRFLFPGIQPPGA